MIEVQCRTCLVITDLDSSVHLVQKHLLGRTLKEIMLLFIPEMVPSLIGDVICIKCYKTLHAFAKFIERSIEVENILKRIRKVVGDSFDKKGTGTGKGTIKSNTKNLPQQFMVIKELQNRLPRSRINSYSQETSKNRTLEEMTNLKGSEELQVQPMLSISSLKQTSCSNSSSIIICDDKEQFRQSLKEQQVMDVAVERQNVLEEKICESCTEPFFQDVVSMLDTTKCKKCLSMEKEKNKVTMVGVSEFNGTDPADSSPESTSSVIEISDNEVSYFDEGEFCYNEIVGTEESINVVRLDSLDNYLIGPCTEVISTSLPTKILPNFLNDLSKNNVEAFQFGAANNTENKRVLLFGKKEFIRCPVCELKFYTHKALNSHFTRNHKDDPERDVFDVVNGPASKSQINRCPICKKIVRSGKILLRHLRLSHREHIPYKCQSCGKCFRLKSRYDNHIKLYKNFDSCNYQKCPFCNEMFSKVEFSKHMEVHKYFTCEQYGESFAKAMCLKTHENKDNHLCFICGKLFKTAQYLNYHLQIHETEGTKVYMCDKCPKSFSMKRRLRNHVKRVHRQKKQFECSECKQKCSTAHALTFHKRLKHSKMYSHICDICGAQFVRGDYFRRHMKSHATSNDPHKPPGPKRYVKTQTEPVQCKYCSKLFKGIYQLRTHILGHIKCIRYKCRLCNLSFSNLTNRLRHEKRHKDPNFELSCKVCWKRMETKEELDEHFVKHNRAKKYKCQECGELIASKYLLRHHISENHISKEEVEKERATVLLDGLEEFLL